MINYLATKLPVYDPITYLVHQFVLGHNKIEIEIITKKFDDSTSSDLNDFKRSIFTRNVMQGCALFGTLASYTIGPFHFILHPFALSYPVCLFSCLFLGHIAGMTLGLCIASRIRYSLLPKISSGC